ncbi:MAG: hypothetical protein GKR89_33365 [Candidatus Latescibacteria bacterium]|nr:hypothetical protein [Candidatus Latescibacterota bacterium]
MTKPLICAHRGLDDSAPENTLAAFAAALDKGMAIELDVQMTADGQLVIMHDPTVDRTTDGSGAVAELTLAQLKKLDAGSWYGAEFAGQQVPTLYETLELVRQRAQVSPAMALDIKQVDADFFEKICSALDKYGLMQEVVGIGAIIFSADVRRQFRQARPLFPCAVVAQTPAERDTALQDPDADWLYTRYAPTVDDIAAARDAGKRVFSSGAAVSMDLNGALAAYRAGADMVLTFQPTELANRLNSGTASG